MRYQIHNWWDTTHPEKTQRLTEKRSNQILHQRRRSVYGSIDNKYAAIEFHQALADAGYDVKLIVVESASHKALTTYSEALKLTIQQVMEMAHSSSP